MKRICVGMSGASGAPIAIRLLERLHDMTDVETHLILTDSAKLTIRSETNWSIDQVEALADRIYGVTDVGSALASGSFSVNATIIVPCSMKTAAGIISGYSDNLLLRAADVAIKEQRPLILVPRESPLSPIHLRNLEELSRIGVRIIPPMLSFYQGFTSIQEWTDAFTERLLAALGFEADPYEWAGTKK